MASQVIGNLISAFVLGDLSQTYFFAIMSTIAFIATILFFFIKKPDLHVDRKLSMINHMIQAEISDQPESSFKEDIMSVLRLMVSKHMRPLLP